MLLQPVCLAYTLCVMHTAAAETARVVLTAEASDTVAERFALARLRTIPELALFHIGGQKDWIVECALEEKSAQVTIQGHARPLPLFLSFAAFLGMTDETGVLLEAKVSECLQASWLEGNYETWTSIWS